MAAKHSSRGPWTRLSQSSWINSNQLLVYLACSAFFIVASAERNYKLHFEKFVVVSYDEENFGDFSGVEMAKYNRSSTVLSGTFNITKDPRPDLLVSIEGYEKIGPQYMLSGIQVKEDFLCMLFDKFGSMIVSPDDTETTNFKTKCPIVEGSYYLKNYRPAETNFPDDVPGNDWRFDVKARYPEMTDSLLLFLQVYLKIERTVTNWKPGMK